MATLFAWCLTALSALGYIVPYRYEVYNIELRDNTNIMQLNNERIQ